MRLMLWLALAAAMVFSVEAVVVTGVVSYSSGSVSLGVQYAMVNATSSGVNLWTNTDSAGRYSLSISGSDTVSLTIQNANLVSFAKTLSVPTSSVSSPSDWDVQLTPLAVPVNGLRVTLEWGSSPSDLDIRALTYCGQVLWSFRRRNPGGVPVRIDQDIQRGYGPETITFGENLPCGVYSIYVASVGKSVYIPSNGAFITVYGDNSPVPLFGSPFFSRPTISNPTLWRVFDYVVTVNAVTKVRSYQFVMRDLYTNGVGIPSVSTPGLNCQNDLQWCATTTLLPGMALLALMLALF